MACASSTRPNKPPVQLAFVTGVIRRSAFPVLQPEKRRDEDVDRSDDRCNCRKETPPDLRDARLGDDARWDRSAGPRAIVRKEMPGRGTLIGSGAVLTDQL